MISHSHGGDAQTKLSKHSLRMSLSLSLRLEIPMHHFIKTQPAIPGPSALNYSPNPPPLPSLW